MRPANSHVKVSVRTVQSTVSVTTLVNGYDSVTIQDILGRATAS